MKQKQRRNKKKERDKHKEPKESKKENKREGRKKRERERQRKRKWKRGGQKGQGERKGNTQKYPFRGENRFFFGPPHLTLKPSKKKHQTKKTKTKHRKKTKHSQKWAFQLSVKFFFFWGGCPKFLFLTTWPKKRAPKTLWKSGFQPSFLWKKDMRHETVIFGPKSPNSETPVITLFCLLSSLSTEKKLKNLLKPLFDSVLENLEKRILKIQNFKLKTQKIEKPNFCTLFLKKAVFFRKLQDHRAQKNTKC